MNEEPHWLGSAAIARAYETGALSPPELVGHLLERIERLDPQIGAFIRVDHEGAMAAAKVAAQEMAAGYRRGPLHGVPVAIKDMIDIAGMHTTCHSSILVDNVAKQDAAVILRMRAAGAVILGKTAMHEFGAGGPAFDLPFPPARNPWNTQYHPGGSSSGSGAAVAAGFCPIALGTDNGGSVRHPASACGVAGLKPTAGTVSPEGVFPAAESLDEVGPIARDVDDIRKVMEVIGGSATNPAAVVHDTPWNDTARPLRGLKIGFVRHFHETDMKADPEVTAALEAGADTLESLGADLRDVVLPDLREMDTVCFLIIQAELASIHARWLRSRPGDYCELTRRALLCGEFISAGNYIRAQKMRRAMREAVDRVFRSVDILLTASSMYPPCGITDRKAIEATYGLQARSAFSMSGHPAISLMSGLSKGGLPLSLQLVAATHADASLLHVADMYQQATGWHRLRPGCGERPERTGIC